MNPLTNMKNVKKLSEQELHQAGHKTSWHDQYRRSAWIFVGGLPYDLTEGDIICIFSQYGEIVNINLIRDKDSGKSKGFCFICYEDQRSTDLAVDNFNGIKILNRTIRVDHVENYKMPKDGSKTDEVTKQLYEEGCAPKKYSLVTVKKEPEDERIRETLADQIEHEIKLPPRLPIFPVKKEVIDDEVPVKVKKEKKKYKKKKSKKKKSKKSSSSDANSADSTSDDSSNEKETSRKEKQKRDRYEMGTKREKSDKLMKYREKISTEHRSRSAERNKYKSSTSGSSSDNKMKDRNRSRERTKRMRSRSNSFDKSKIKHRKRSESLDRDRKYHR